MLEQAHDEQLTPWDYESGKITGIILARGGSKGVPMKNIKMLAGKPLVAWALTAMLDSNVFENVYVSTDSEEIAEVVRQYGGTVFMRDPIYAQDHVSSMDSIREVLLKHPEIDMNCMVQCTSPCLHPFHLQEAVALLRNHKYDSIFSVFRQKSYRWKFSTNEDGLSIPANFNVDNKPAADNWEGELYENGSFYMGRRLNVFQSSYQCGKIGYYEMGKEYSCDIDTEFDFTLAEQIVSRYGYNGQRKTTK